MTVDARHCWRLTLYVSGASPHSVAALAAVRRLCDGELAGRVELQVVDVLEQPDVGADGDVVAIPTLIRWFPEPQRVLVGDLGEDARLRRGLELPAEGGRVAENRSP